MRLAEKISELSPCRRKKTGAVIACEDGRMVVGYNHLPRGVNAVDVCDHCPREGKTPGDWVKRECPVIHAEVDAVYRAAALGVNTSQGVMYCTYKPCMGCAVTAVEAGVIKIVYRDDYPGGEDVKEYLARCGVELEKHMDQ